MTRSTPVRVNAAALLLAIIGMIVQIANGVKYPTVPPGIVILAAATLLITLLRWPAVRLLGVLVPLFILIGGIVSSTGRTNISHVADPGKFAGTVVQFGGLGLGIAAGIAAVIEWRRGRAARHADTATGPLASTRDLGVGGQA